MLQGLRQRTAMGKMAQARVTGFPVAAVGSAQDILLGFSVLVIKLNVVLTLD